MKAINALLLAFVVLALCAAVAKVVAIILLGLIVVAFIARPRQAIGCLLTLMLIGLVGRYPMPGFALLSAITVLAIAKQFTEH